ncbi:exopolyphosphatase [Anaerobacillus alkaliphilus]|uniref:Exopolyphosphatase n=1 Tax=Anaerobacillus alkaliphilus TaxID=1548597 RepID=A0A4Q0VS70_9BACI|nr:exopolyphosphatase [Anaerobacillus alkaliphilus]RXI99429.1 exopolyphosphatase [Anaerobacillus alkaliphilus]
MTQEQSIALIDIGSNSIRLVIFQLDGVGYYKEIQNLKVVARLSSHITEDGELSDKGVSVLLNTLKQFQEITRTYNLSIIKCVATAAIRQAKNQQAILKKIAEQTDFSIRVLSEYEEAYFGFLAVTNSTSINDGITIDIGGGSTEVTLFKNRKLLHYHSFPFGAISLKQKFIQNEIPTKEELENLRGYLKTQFETLHWLKQLDLPLVGIGGSARNLSLIHQRSKNYPLSGLHQYEMDFENLKEIINTLGKLSLKERQFVEGLSKDRADIIIPAAEAIIMLMEVTSSKSFIMSNKGLRDGLFYDELFNQNNITQFPNVAEESIYQLTRNYEINIQHVKYISKIATNLFDDMTQLFNHLTKEDLRLLHLSCRVLYIGEFISHEASSQHTFYLLTNLSIDGITHIERLKIALIASFKSKATLQNYLKPYTDWFQRDEIDTIELLGAILKFSYGLNRTKREVFTSVHITEKSNEMMELKLHHNQDAYFEISQAKKYKKHLEKVVKRRIELLFCKN